MTASEESVPTFPAGVHLGGREEHCACIKKGEEGTLCEVHDWGGGAVKRESLEG